MSGKPFPAYSGNDPYFFVSYAHEDADLIYPEMAWIEAAGFNLWYDDGIGVGSVWRQALADALSAASGLLFFATEQSTASSNCLQEINFALDEGKPVFVVQLDEHKLPGLLRLSLNDRQALRRSEHDEETYRQRLVSALATVTAPAVRASSPAAPQSSVAARIKTDPPSIAILPLTCMGDDPEIGYLAQGIVGDLIARLSMRVWHVVTGHQDDATMTPTEIGTRRGVRYVLGGSVQRGGNKVRVRIRLARCSDGEEIWAKRFDRELSDTFELADQLVNTIDFQLFDPLFSAEARRLKGTPVEEVDSWGLCALARERWVDRESRDRVRGYLELAIERDRDFAHAHSMYAGFLCQLVWAQFTREPEDTARLALHHSDRALALSPDSITALQSATLVHSILGDHRHALELARRCERICGAPPNTMFKALVSNGLFDEAMTLIDEHPYLEGSTGNVVLVTLFLGRPEEALDRARRDAGETSWSYLSWAALAAAQSACGQTEVAIRSFRHAQELLPTLTVDRYEKGQLISWRDTALIEPAITALRALPLD